MSVQDRIEACKSHARDREAEGKRADSLWEACEIAEEQLARAERAERIVRAIEKEIVIQTPPPGYQFDGDKIVNVLRAILEDSP